MKLEDLQKKLSNLNKLNSEVGIEDRKYFLVVKEKYSKPIYLYSKKDFKKIAEYYTNEVYDAIISNELIQVERFIYNVSNTEIEVQIGI